jgi:hypothetical protein
MGLLDMLTGNSQVQAGFQDFLKRFQEGPPSEGYDDQEVMDRYGQVAHDVSPADYQEAARDAFGHLSETDREDFGRMLAGQAQTRGIDIPGPTSAQGQDFGNLDWLSNITGQLHQQPGLLREILGGLTGNSQSGSGGSIFSNPIAKAAMAGITAMVVRKVLGSR